MVVMIELCTMSSLEITWSSGRKAKKRNKCSTQSAKATTAVVSGTQNKKQKKAMVTKKQWQDSSGTKIN